MQLKAYKVHTITTWKEYEQLQPQLKESYFQVVTDDDQNMSDKLYDLEEVYNAIKDIKAYDKETGATGIFTYSVVLRAVTDNDIYELYGNVRKTKSGYTFTPAK